MKINGQLERIISRHFSDSRDKIYHEKSEEYNKACKEYEKKKKEKMNEIYTKIKEDEDFKTLVSSANIIFDKYKLEYKGNLTSFFNNLSNIVPSDLFIQKEIRGWNNTLSNEINDKYEARFDELETQMNILYLKLEYSENFEEIIKILAESGIKI